MSVNTKGFDAQTTALVGAPANDAMRRTTMLAVAVVGLFLVVKAAWSASTGGVGELLWVTALFVLPSLYAVPATRRRLDGHRWQVVAVQAVLTWLPLALFRGSWNIGLGGLLAALVLLTARSRAAWLVAGLLAAADVLVRVAVKGMLPDPGWTGVVTTADVFVDDALYFFVVVRLAQIVGEVEQAHLQAAELTVARERLRAARALQTAVGERLVEVAAHVGAARRALSRDAAEARTLVAAAGATARETVARARAITSDWEGSATLEAKEPPVAGVMMGGQLAWAVLIVMLIAYVAQGVNSAFIDHVGARLGAILAVFYALTVALQLRHSLAARRGRRPRAWPATLALQAALVYMFFLPPLRAFEVMVPFLAGSVLLLIGGRWRWIAYTAVVVSWTGLFATVHLTGLPAGNGGAFYVAYSGAFIALTGLVVYGMSWLVGLAVQLEGLRGEVVRTAAVREQLRVDRDVHDLLGLWLSAVALKADLIGALIGRDDARAAAEMAEISRICAAAQADARLVTRDGTRLSICDELAAAKQILTSAGLAVDVEIHGEPLPPEADEVLAPALREAVTNVLRHSVATWCRIRVDLGADALELRVVNDGVREQPERLARPDRGHGLVNMTARMRAAGGRLSHSTATGVFELAAEIPLVQVRPHHNRTPGWVLFPRPGRRLDLTAGPGA